MIFEPPCMLVELQLNIVCFVPQVPTRPDKPNIKTDSTIMEISWSSPKGSEKIPAKDYRVEYQGGEVQGSEKTQQKTQFTVTDLEHYHKYEVCVRALYEKGFGPVSTSEEAVTRPANIGKLHGIKQSNILKLNFVSYFSKLIISFTGVGTRIKLEGGMGTCRPQDPLFSCQILALELHLFKPFSRSGDPTWIF